MERESFEDATIAAILNRDFVSVKVDREERPDVDKTYMTYVQATTGGGGWPMSVWLTPDLKPFFGGTYFPPEDRWGHPGFRTVLLRIAEAWQTDRARIEAAGNTVSEQLRQAVTPPPSKALAASDAIAHRTYEALKASYDSEYGGFGNAPKFPQPSVPDFLLRYHAHTGDHDALAMTLNTLRKMAEGGIYDQLGGGFHRYSVDERWHVPHFEKMLYDQAQLACLYLDAYQLTRESLFPAIARGILDYVRRDMTGKEGRFFSAEDADSPHPNRPDQRAEGAYYVWTHDETVSVLGAETAAVFGFHYGIMQDGNVRHDPHGEFSGVNVLMVSRALKETAQRFSITPDRLQRLLADARRRMAGGRARRPRPPVDDKTLTAWNGLMISALARAAQVLADDTYLDSARAAAGFLREHLYDPRRGILWRRYRAGESAIEGYADDYTFLIQGLLDLHEASFDAGYLTWAIALQKKQDELFRDDDGGGYFSTTGNDDSILLRMKDTDDGAEPSPNSIGLSNLLRLWRMTGNPSYGETAEKILAAFSDRLRRYPQAMPRMAAAAYDFFDSPPQIVIAGNPAAAETRDLLREVHARYMPHRILIPVGEGANRRELEQHCPLVASLHPRNGRATAYVCENHVCRLPTDDPKVLAAQLDARTEVLP